MPEEILEYENLIIQYLRNELSVENKMLLDQWRLAAEKNQQLFDELTREQSLQDKLKRFHEIETTVKERSREAIRKTIFPEEDTQVVTMKNNLKWGRWIVAASILIIVIMGSYFMLRQPASKETEILAKQSEDQRFKNDVEPGKSNAILVMGDGQKTVLEEHGYMKLGEKNGSSIESNNGVIQYNGKSIATSAPEYHTLYIPRKGEYKLVLNDGSTVRLNSESSIYFPTVFAGSERRVKITGEAYFEVAKQEGKPFIVSVGGVDIKVLGTHFNVNAYGNETSIKTTLTEGSVEVIATGKTVRIEPGQQAQVKTNGQLKVVDDVNVDEVLAWANGYFNFRDASIESIMRQVERWYDVEVVYEAQTSQLFIAKIPRTVTVSEFLRILEATGWVHFKIDGQKITVLR